MSRYPKGYSKYGRGFYLDLSEKREVTIEILKNLVATLECDLLAAKRTTNALLMDSGKPALYEDIESSAVSPDPTSSNLTVVEAPK